MPACTLVGSRRRFSYILGIAACCMALVESVSLTAVSSAEKPKTKPAPVAYPDQVSADAPVAYWRMADPDGKRVVNSGTAGSSLDGSVVSTVTLQQPGPRTEQYPLFKKDNRAIAFNGRQGHVRVADPGANSPLDFTNGDAITLEAWVNPEGLGSNQMFYVIGKGRNGNSGFASDNQNYALRILGSGGEAKLSFLFRPAKSKTGARTDWHRWDSKTGLPLDGGWHHIAVCYLFGDPKSIRSYVDGKPVEGTWDAKTYGGPTEKAPVVDNDELRIGSSSANTFRGGIDEVAIYRKVLTPERIKLRYQAIAPKPYITEIELPTDGVLVEVQEKIPGNNSWSFVPPKPVERFIAPAFGFRHAPQKYSNRGYRIERGSRFVLRVTGLVELPPGKHQFLVRARSSARLFVDGKQVVQTPFHNISGSAHGKVRHVERIKESHIRTLQTGDNEELAIVESTGKTHRFRLEIYVGGKGKRAELGETCVAWRPAGSKQPFRLLSPKANVLLTEEGWLDYRDTHRNQVDELNNKNRRQAAKGEIAYWNKRHAAAKQVVAAKPAPSLPEVSKKMPVRNPIDRYIGAKLEAAGKQPTKSIDDLAFVRRASIDIIGTIPTPQQIETYLADPPADRRKKLIDRLLDHPGWADNWVGYWQDVLAENPNILKPTLNNTGPFRFWIHEALTDNKPLDRFVTELLLMEGGTYTGGPAGFAMAAQNDVPMAAKAHVVGQAFLGLNMKCARCHDAPFHDFKQKNLFALAAMLKRGPQGVPKTSSIPLPADAIESLIVKVTLKPGTNVAPEWPFPELSPPKLDAGMLRDEKDSRERLAALITSPQNERFARVMVNRVWHRYMDRGIVESVDDWEQTDPSHPELLSWLAREFVLHGYDFKHVARLILNSDAYQRAAVSEKVIANGEAYLFPGPVRRRMTAEQLLDSMFVAAGKTFDSGQLTMDNDGSRPNTSFLNFGEPRHAWEFTSLSNERDRPSLAMPFTQDFVSLLKSFGWRAARQAPLTIRDDTPTILQPSSLANGTVGRRITRLSDNSSLTELALEKQTTVQLVDRIFLQMLTRKPSDEERELFVGLLHESYDQRIINVDPKLVVRRFKRPTGVAWSNHLSEEANRIKIAMERLVSQGDPPSVQLQTDWRERMEDMVWALMNSPEFVFVP
jgi:hypothetical protein